MNRIRFFSFFFYRKKTFCVLINADIERIFSLYFMRKIVKPSWTLWFIIHTCGMGNEKQEMVQLLSKFGKVNCIFRQQFNHNDFARLFTLDFRFFDKKSNLIMLPSWLRLESNLAPRTYTAVHYYQPSGFGRINVEIIWA